VPKKIPRGLKLISLNDGVLGYSANRSQWGKRKEKNAIHLFEPSAPQWVCCMENARRLGFSMVIAYKENPKPKRNKIRIIDCGQ
jgi:hypothetical protein